MHETILVAGATGVVGNEVVKQLAARGKCVRLGVHDLRKAANADTGGCPVVPFDYTKPATFDAALDGIESIFLSTPISFPRIDELLMPFVEAASKAGVGHITSLGSIGVDQGSSPLLIHEKCIIHCGIPYTILRSNLLMQNFKTLAADSIRKTNAIYLPAGAARISFIDARDIAAAAAETLLDTKHRNILYVLTGREALNHSEIAHILSKVTGKTITYMPISHNEAKQQLREKGWDERDAELMVGLYEIARHGWSSEISTDIAGILGREPIDFEKFALDYRECWL